ncbi:NAD-dependent epimerase/dehydratase family protein [Glaciibacter superstes]|uniref:NAD-dependent epimerase/dehydratase family protein n=1 Tax=Glaciibacter superstes TaxID=501023 RepID=UPI0003B6C5B5|nr:NAD(P)-dependent oxidoreductase [Glaciibacter superstes]
MRVFLAGATGALGRRLLPKLLEAGFDVTGTTSSSSKLAALEAAGVHGVVMDGLDVTSVDDAVAGARPDVVVHQLTALAHMSGNPRNFEKDFAETNRLRTRGTDLLLAAARAAGTERFIAQSYAGWPSERTGSWVKGENDPLDPAPTAVSARTVEAIRHLEAVVTGATDLDGLALRYGSLYGPGTGLGTGGNLLAMVAKRRFPVAGGGTGMFSFCHIDDAATATVAAVTHGAPGVYIVADDEPAPVSEWLPYLAASIGAKPPMRLPAWLAAPLLGEHGMSMMTQIRGSSNAKAKAELGWRPSYPSWREGFRSGLS